MKQKPKMTIFISPFAFKDPIMRIPMSFVFGGFIRFIQLNLFLFFHSSGAEDQFINYYIPIEEKIVGKLLKFYIKIYSKFQRKEISKQERNSVVSNLARLTSILIEYLKKTGALMHKHKIGIQFWKNSKKFCNLKKIIIIISSFCFL